MSHIHTSPRNHKLGFALVISLSLMAFVVLLLLSITTLLQTEIVSSKISKDQLAARQNALLALQVAVGQLQKETGPDQRITARAEILDSDHATPSLENLTQPFWTGTWKTGANEPDIAEGGSPPQRQTTFAAASASTTLSEKTNSASWLISRPTGVTTLDPRTFNATVSTQSSAIAAAAAQSGISSSGSNSPTAAILAKNIGRRDPTENASGNPGYIVAAPLVEVGENGQQGRYAYWVADEGLKAKVNLTADNASMLDATSSDEAVSQRQRHYISPSMNAPEMSIESNFRNNFSTLDTTVFEKIKSLEAFAFAAGDDSGGVSFDESPNGLNLSWPDLTAHSFGVLSDVRNGGLKKDLTAAFEIPGEFDSLINSNPGDAEQQKRIWISELSTSEIANGPLWASYYFFYNIYKAAMPSFRTPNTSLALGPKGIGGPSTTTPEVEMRAYNLENYVQVNGSSNRIKLAPIGPSVLGFRFEVGISSEQAGAGYSLRLHHFPAIILHNPYNVKLTPSPGNDMTLRIGSNVFTQSTVFDFKINGASELQTSLGFYLHGNSVGQSSIELKTTDDQAELSFEPGEIKIFGMSADDARSFVPSDQSYDNGHKIDQLTTSNIDLQSNKSVRLTGGTALDGLNDLQADDLIAIDRLTWGNTDRIRANDFEMKAENTRHWPDDVGGIPYREYSYPEAGIPDTVPIGSERAEIFGGDVPVSALDPSVGGGSIQRINGFTITAKGYHPERDIKAALFGGSGSHHRPGNLMQQMDYADIRNRVGTVFSSEEEFSFTPEGASFWGEFDAGRPGNNTPVILKELPIQPMLSLGQFMHIDDSWLHNSTYSIKAPLVPVGGSLANPAFIDQTILEKDKAASLSTHKDGLPFFESDDAYLNNRELFDRTFFSTIPPSSTLKTGSSSDGTRYPPEWEDFDQSSVDKGRALLNPRLVFTPRADGSSPKLDGSAAERPLRSTQHAAAGLLVDGAFNVNSTSVAAWRALLSSLRFNGQSGESPMPRFTTTLATDENYGEGMRILSDTQIDSLAQEIVKQVKLRGPFLSMGDFINRRRVSGELGTMGALQAAIDASQINATALAQLGTASDRTFDASRLSVRGQQLLQGYMPSNTAAGAPGVIMQHDILQALAPVLTARSDTFIIRTYGESINPVTGKSKGETWCEAVVQRLPHYLDQTDAALNTLGDATAPSDLTANSLNQRMGRRFTIVSLRWLNESEI